MINRFLEYPHDSFFPEESESEDRKKLLQGFVAKATGFQFVRHDDRFSTDIGVFRDKESGEWWLASREDECGSSRIELRKVTEEDYFSYHYHYMG